MTERPPTDSSRHSDKIEEQLQKRGLFDIAGDTVPRELMVLAYRESGPPSEYIDAPAGLAQIVPLGDDDESKRIERELETELGRGNGNGQPTVHRALSR